MCNKGLDFEYRLMQSSGLITAAIFLPISKKQEVLDLSFVLFWELYPQYCVMRDKVDY